MDRKTLEKIALAKSGKRPEISPSEVALMNQTNFLAKNAAALEDVYDGDFDDKLRRPVGSVEKQDMTEITHSIVSVAKTICEKYGIKAETMVSLKHNDHAPTLIKEVMLELTQKIVEGEVVKKATEAKIAAESSKAAADLTHNAVTKLSNLMQQFTQDMLKTKEVPKQIPVTMSVNNIQQGQLVKGIKAMFQHMKVVTSKGLSQFPSAFIDKAVESDCLLAVVETLDVTPDDLSFTQSIKQALIDHL